MKCVLRINPSISKAKRNSLFENWCTSWVRRDQRPHLWRQDGRDLRGPGGRRDSVTPTEREEISQADPLGEVFLLSRERERERARGRTPPLNPGQLGEEPQVTPSRSRCQGPLEVCDLRVSFVADLWGVQRARQPWRPEGTSSVVS